MSFVLGIVSFHQYTEIKVVTVIIVTLPKRILFLST